MNKESKKKLSKPVKLALELGVFVLIFVAIQFWQTKDLSPINSNLYPYLHLQTSAQVPFGAQSLAGKKTLLYIFAPWCGVCTATSGSLASLADDLGDEVNVIALALSYEDRAEIVAYKEKYNFNFPVLLGLESISRGLKVEAFPTFYILDEQGRLAYRTVGYTTAIGLRFRLML